MDINLENDTTNSIHEKINEYLQKCEISKAEFTVSSDGKKAHLISYKTERQQQGFWRCVGKWFVSRLDIVLIATICVVIYWRVSTRVNSEVETSQCSMPRSSVVKSMEHSSVSRTIGERTLRDEVVISRCVTNTVQHLTPHE